LTQTSNFHKLFHKRQLASDSHYLNSYTPKHNMLYSSYSTRQYWQNKVLKFTSTSTFALLLFGKNGNILLHFSQRKGNNSNTTL